MKILILAIAITMVAFALWALAMYVKYKNNRYDYRYDNEKNEI